jgi:hypothetical protein
LFAKPSRYDGKKVKIAAIAGRAKPHPDFDEAWSMVNYCAPRDPEMDDEARLGP